MTKPKHLEQFKARERKINDFMNENKMFRYCTDENSLVPPPEGRPVLIQTKDGKVFIAVCNDRQWYLQNNDTLPYNKVLAWTPVPVFRGPRSHHYKSTKEKGATNDISHSTKVDNPRRHNGGNRHSDNSGPSDSRGYGLHGFYGGHNRERQIQEGMGVGEDEGLYYRNRAELARLDGEDRNFNR
ncbi:hypothetical protein IBZ20DMU1_49 [Acinetobacter phage DMU1]|nr:hypothetical protein IBZ20DMU1_49 [Acinetobacter phage DMU1]